MALLWLVQLVSWLALQMLALALHLAPAAAALMTLTAIVLVSAMTTQALEHGVLASMHRSKWHKNSQYDDLRRDFYRGYWLVTLLYVVSSALWIYFTERTGARVVCGAVFCAVWWGAQLAMVIALPLGRGADQDQDGDKVLKLLKRRRNIIEREQDRDNSRRRESGAGNDLTLLIDKSTTYNQVRSLYDETRPAYCWCL